MVSIKLVRVRENYRVIIEFKKGGETFQGLHFEKIMKFLKTLLSVELKENLFTIYFIYKS